MRKCVALAVLVIACGLGAAPGVGAASGAQAAAKPEPKITFPFGLKRPETAARTAFAAAQDPSSPAYRRFLTVPALKAKYGASPATVAAFRRTMGRLGFAVSIDASGVFARVTGTPSQFAKLLSVKISASFDNDPPSNGWFVAPGHAARIPAALRPLVSEVVPFYARSVTLPKPKPEPAAASRRRTTVRDVSPRATPPPVGPVNTGTWTGGCAQAQATGGYAYGQARTAYGLDGLGPGGGASVAILNVGEGLGGSDVRDNASCFGYPKLTSRTLLTDGQSAPFPQQSFEPEEDLALVRGTAPGLTKLTFSQVWLAPDLWFTGAAQVLAAGQLPDVFSMSYGICERDVRGHTSQATASTRAGADLMDAILVRLGIAGVSSFASAGDSGSTCNGDPFKGVAWPASSPYVTAVGGTRLTVDAANARTDEVVWNDTEWSTPESPGGAGGGGYSVFSPRPSYQAGLPIAGVRRAVPDVSAHASMFPGWPVVLGGNWDADGGTSAAAPLVATAFATISARERAAGRPPLGPVNGLLYALRASTPSALFDVVSGNNAFIPQVPGRSATPGYDLASGLGVPRFDQVAAVIPPPGS